MQMRLLFICMDNFEFLSSHRLFVDHSSIYNRCENHQTSSSHQRTGVRSRILVCVCVCVGVRREDEVREKCAQNMNTTWLQVIKYNAVWAHLPLFQLIESIGINAVFSILKAASLKWFMSHIHTRRTYWDFMHSNVWMPGCTMNQQQQQQQQIPIPS